MYCLVEAGEEEGRGCCLCGCGPAGMQIGFSYQAEGSKDEGIGGVLPGEGK